MIPTFFSLWCLRYRRFQRVSQASLPPLRSSRGRPSIPILRQAPSSPPFPLLPKNFPRPSLSFEPGPCVWSTSWLGYNSVVHCRDMRLLFFTMIFVWSSLKHQHFHVKWDDNHAGHEFWYSTLSFWPPYFHGIKPNLVKRNAGLQPRPILWNLLWITKNHDLPFSDILELNVHHYTYQI